MYPAGNHGVHKKGNAPVSLTHLAQGILGGARDGTFHSVRYWSIRYNVSAVDLGPSVLLENHHFPPTQLVSKCRNTKLSMDFILVCIACYVCMSKSMKLFTFLLSPIGH